MADLKFSTLKLNICCMKVKYEQFNFFAQIKSSPITLWLSVDGLMFSVVFSRESSNGACLENNDSGGCDAITTMKLIIF